MCQRVECAQCGRPTYAGCGRHVESVLANVPQDQRCQCRAASPSGTLAKDGKARRGFWRLFGR